MKKRKLACEIGNDERFVLLIKYWKDGNTDLNVESTMIAKSLRAARNEFRSQLRNLLVPAEIKRELMNDILKVGYVVVAGPIDVLYDRFAMILVDRTKLNQHSGMYAFEHGHEGWRLNFFERDNSEQGHL